MLGSYVPTPGTSSQHAAPDAVFAESAKPLIVALGVLGLTKS
jgi:hypothetical protein